ncbi:MAG: hypothetical protein OXG85_13580 [Chloroflexi bacterium]|nr:hypothetical protein [Chloroflexota bacterium]
MSNPVHFRIVDTNVPLTAAGYNDSATEDCRIKCLEFLERVFSGEIAVVIDGMNEALSELARNVPSQERADNIAGRFLIHLFNNIGNPATVRVVELKKTPSGKYDDYPDNEGSWKTNEPRCRTFDEDDKKWVALAAKFKRETGTDAPIANAGDRCWIAFELMLSFSGVSLEFLCPDYSNTN